MDMVGGVAILNMPWTFDGFGFYVEGGLGCFNQQQFFVCSVLPSVVANNNGQKSFLKQLWNIFHSSTVDCCTSSAKLDCSCGCFSRFYFWQ